MHPPKFISDGVETSDTMGILFTRYFTLWASGTNIRVLIETVSSISIGIMLCKVQRRTWKRPKK